MFLQCLYPIREKLQLTEKRETGFKRLNYSEKLLSKNQVPGPMMCSQRSCETWASFQKCLQESRYRPSLEKYCRHDPSMYTYAISGVAPGYEKKIQLPKVSVWEVWWDTYCIISSNKGSWDSRNTNEQAHREGESLDLSCSTDPCYWFSRRFGHDDRASSPKEATVDSKCRSKMSCKPIRTDPWLDVFRWWFLMEQIQNKRSRSFLLSFKRDSLLSFQFKNLLGLTRRILTYKNISICFSSF